MEIKKSKERITILTTIDKTPNKYFKIVFEHTENKDLKYGNINDINVLRENLRINCISEDIISMYIDNYEDSLLERRKLVARKIQTYYNTL